MYLESRRMLARSRVHEIRRQEARYVCSVPVVLQRFLRYGPFVTRGVSLDISKRGMSALVCGAPRVGETVVIELPLLKSPVEMLATVRHSSNAKTGFEFYPLSPAAEQGIEEWMEELRRHEGMQFRYLHASTAKFGWD